ncbi:CD63 antigen-like [Antedon mediterranea]|uniref:CD63 antigen-like n=1 Tax=Antedon mediterranea TaxID=105859 RepID=UPI003AF8E574
MAEGGMKLVKFMLFFFNVIFWLCGLGLIIGGCVVLKDYSDYVDFTGDMGNTVPIFIIVVGAIIFITGFCGCCGAMKESYCMVATYTCILVILLIIEIGLGIAGFVESDALQDQIEDNMLSTMPQYKKEEATKKLWDDMQQNLECCGTNNYTEWYEYLDDSVPDSCCDDNDCKNVVENAYDEGCSKALFDYFNDNIAIIAGVAIGVALVQLIGVMCACCLMRSIKNEYEVV